MSAASLAGKTRLQQRFLSEDLEKIPSGYVDLFGPADVFYPEWMEGRWQVEQTLGKYTAPLGKKFLGATAEKTLAEEQKRLGTPISFELRYVRTARGNLVEDRAFNVRSRLDAFAGKKVVREVAYADVPNFGREDMMKKGDGPNDPLLTVVIQFKGATQKQFITRFLTELGDDGNVFRVLACQRSLFAIGSEAAVAVDEEVTTSLRRKPDGSVAGRLRLLGFLNPNDALFFDAANKAVTIADYSLRFTRLAGAGRGAAEPAA